MLFNINKTKMNQLQKMQNKMLKTQELFSVHPRYVWKALILVYRIKHNLLQSHLVENFNSHFPTRRKDSFFVETFRGTQITSSVRVGGLKLFDSLPTEVRSTFVLLCVTFFLSVYL